MSSYMHKTLVTLTAVAGLVLASTNAQAAVLYANAGAGVLSDGLTTTIGVQFTANANFTITQLGFFDDGSNGNVVAHGVGLYTDTGTLLRSTTIQAGNASPLSGEFRYEFVTPFTLTSGTTYRLGGAIFTGSGDSYRDVSNSFTLGAFNVTVIDGVYQGAQTAGLNFPADGGNGSVLPGGAYIGPTFGDAPIPTPEPSAISLLTLGALGLTRLIRRRR